MNFYLLFGLFPKEMQDEIYKNSKRDVQNAANILQWNIVRALDEAGGDELNFEIVNSLYVPSYPKGYKQAFIPSMPFSHKEGAKDFNVGFFNPYLLASTFKYWSLKKHFRKKLKNNSDDTTILFYALTLPFAKLARYVKKKYPQVQVCAVVPDLPQYMDTQKGKKAWYKRIVKEKRIKAVYSCTKFIDKFIVLTESMKKDLNTENYMVMEGIAPKFKEFSYVQRDKKIILYAGTLNKRYGIMDLVEAFSDASKENADLELHIYGYGDSVSAIKEASSNNPAIKYFGNISSDALQNAILNADVLVNPRKNNEVFTKFSFPSKNLDYLSYGIPFVGYKLDGVPSEYYSYILSPDGDENVELAQKLLEAASMSRDERYDYYMRVRNFIENNKTCLIQGQRIIDFLFKKEELCRNDNE